ncbi:hypothetical protein CHUAL_011917 [Chamberlinius hualienensis]
MSSKHKQNIYFKFKIVIFSLQKSKMKFALALLFLFGLTVAVFAEEYEDESSSSSSEEDNANGENLDEPDVIANGGDVASFIARHRRCAGRRSTAASTTTVAA